MGTGTPAKGKFARGKTHIICRRCGRKTYHAAHKYCASCGFGKTRKLRVYNWKNKSKK